MYNFEVSSANQNKNVLIAWHHNTFPHAEAVLQVATEIISTGANPIILDLTKQLPLYQTSISKYLSRKFDRLHQQAPNHALREESSNLSISLIQPRNNKRLSLLIRALLMQIKISGTAKELETDTRWGGLGPALASDLVTQIALDEYASVARNPFGAFRSIRAFLVNEKLTKDVLSNMNIASVVVFNGRLCPHSGVWSAAKSSNVNVYFYEVGAGPYYFFESFRPHDRSRIQEKSRVAFENLGESEKDRLASDFRNRRTLTSLNRFLELQLPSAGEPVLDISPNVRVAVIYTSSPEELIGVGASWENFGWENQYEAIRATVVRLELLGFKVVIRIHPNIANKSWREFNRAMRAFRGLSCPILLPYDQVNSYDLLESASIVVVWRSTIGLEASALGKPTYCLNPTRYDLTADVKTIHNAENLKKEVFRTYSVDAKKAMPAIFWSNSLGFSHRRNLSDNWEELKENFYKGRRVFMKINRFFVLIDDFVDIKERPTNLFRFIRIAFGKKKTQNFIRKLYGYESFRENIL